MCVWCGRRQESRSHEETLLSVTSKILYICIFGIKIISKIIHRISFMYIVYYLNQLSCQTLIKHVLVKNLPSKMKFFGVKEFLSCIMIWKMGVKINLRIITKNHTADSKIRSPKKSILELIRLTSPTRQPGS